VENYHRERPHQGLGGELIVGEPAFPQPANGPIKCHSRLGGTLNYYFREAVSPVFLSNFRSADGWHSAPSA